MTTVIGSLCWRVFASSFPLVFASNPFVPVLVRLCLFLEATGICSSSWLTAGVLTRCLGFKPDSAHLAAASGPAAVRKISELAP